MSRQTQAIIHADAILSNFKLLAELAPTSRSMAVVKADAYGHGAVNVSRILQHVSPRFAVAIIEEAIALREAGITAAYYLAKSRQWYASVGFRAEHATEYC